MEKRYQNIIQIYNTVAQGYQDKFANDTVYNHSYDLLLKHMKPTHKNVLDVACGFGKITHYLLNHNTTLSVLGIDAAENMVNLAKQNNPKASFKVMDCREINSLQQGFDVIIFGFCFPYLTKDNVLKLIEEASILLNSNGLLYISTMIGDYEKDSRDRKSVV